MALPSSILDVTQTHLEQLVADRTREGPHLDFKRDLPTAWNNEAKHEFLADTTAFANAGGGDLIYGVDEDGNANADRLVPQVLANLDQEVRRLQDFLLSLAEPRVPGVQVHAIPVTVGAVSGHAVIVRIPQSWAGPHRVKTNQHFYVRDGARKRQLDVPELRSLVLRTENQAQRVRDFRTERLGKILSGDVPVRMVINPVLVVHLIPTQAALGLVQVDPIPYVRNRGLPVIATSTELARINVDGALAIRNETKTGHTHGYSLFFRNGYFESTYSISHYGEGRAVLASTSFEKYLIKHLRLFREELDHLGINLECSVMISILGADEVQLGVVDKWGQLEPHHTLFDRKTIVLPDVLVPADATPEQGLKPAFDLVWQAAGFEGSWNYTDAGKWTPP